MQTLIIGIAGPSASGKTLLADTIIKEFANRKVLIITEDSYYKANKNLSMMEKVKINYDHPNSFDHNLLVEHLQKLKDGKSIEVPIYNHKIYERTDKTSTIIGNIIIVEGILLFVDNLVRSLIDIKFFMETPLDICLSRRIRRDLSERNRSIDSVLEQYEKTVKPMFLQFIEPSKKYADIIVPNGGTNRIAVDLIKSKMREFLGDENENT